jgi:hypothetical protein
VSGALDSQIAVEPNDFSTPEGVLMISVVSNIFPFLNFYICTASRITPRSRLLKLQTKKATWRRKMSSAIGQKKNQPPTGEGKKQSPNDGSAQELDKRSEVLQAQRNHPELNMETDDETADQAQDMDVPQKRDRAGR